MIFSGLGLLFDLVCRDPSELMVVILLIAFFLLWAWMSIMSSTFSVLKGTFRMAAMSPLLIVGSMLSPAMRTIDSPLVTLVNSGAIGAFVTGFGV